MSILFRFIWISLAHNISCCAAGLFERLHSIHGSIFVLLSFFQYTLILIHADVYWCCLYFPWPQQYILEGRMEGKFWRFIFMEELSWWRWFDQYLFEVCGVERYDMIWWMCVWMNILVLGVVGLLFDLGFENEGFWDLRWGWGWDWWWKWEWGVYLLREWVE